jgi:hypothetical protein
MCFVVVAHLVPGDVEGFMDILTITMNPDFIYRRHSAIITDDVQALKDRDPRER